MHVAQLKKALKPRPDMYLVANLATVLSGFSGCTKHIGAIKQVILDLGSRCHRKPVCSCGVHGFTCTIKALKPRPNMHVEQITKALKPRSDMYLVANLATVLSGFSACTKHIGAVVADLGSRCHSKTPVQLWCAWLHVHKRP